jgi:hypothetical protein
MNMLQNVIEKLITETKNKNLKWFYLNEFELLDDKSSSLITAVTTYILDNSSFYVKIKDGYFVLCEDNYNDLYLITFPSIDSRDFKCLNDTGNGLAYQQELLRLQNLIKKQFPNVDDFLDDFLND